MTDTNTTLIDETLERSIDTIYPSKDVLKKKLLDGKPLKIYVGIDPTADYVHLGHSTNYLVLERFHQLGHKIIVLVGDFTAMIGDPSDKTSERIKLSVDQVQKNLKSFKSQIGKILPFNDTQNPIEFKFNSHWLSKLTFEDVVELASNFTVQQMIERDMFASRLKAGKPIHMHEFFYPLMQGYDSVAMDVDIEVGGTDQTFNMLAGRTLLKRLKNKEKIVITTTLLENPVTGEKLMSKSLGTGIGLSEAPSEMFAKAMTLPDEGLIQCFVDCTRLPMSKISEFKQDLKNNVNPRDIKLLLAHEIVSMYHDKAEADQAQESWVSQFSNKEIPIPKKTFKFKPVEFDLIDMIVNVADLDSRSEARRLLDQGAVKVDGAVIDSNQGMIGSGAVIQVGKRHTAKIEHF